MALLAACGLPGTAVAGPADPGWTVGAGGTFNDYQLDGGAIDDTAPGFKAWSQYRFNRILGLGMTWLRTSDFKQDNTPGEAGGDAALNLQGISFDLLGDTPGLPDSLQLFGKAGYYALDQDLELDGSSAATRKAEGITLGAGLDVAVARQWSVRLEASWFDLDSADFWTTGLGINYHFGAP